MHFLSMLLSGIIAITISNSDSASPWNIPPRIFISAKIFPQAVNSTLQFFIVSSINFMISSYIFYILRQSIIQLCGTISYTVLWSIQAIDTFLRFALLSARVYWSMCRISRVPLVLLWHYYYHHYYYHSFWSFSLLP